MARPSRLPRCVRIGRGYHLIVVLANQTTLREIAEAEDDELLDGFWDSKLSTIGGLAGIIYIHNKLTVAQRWDIYWHELLHAVNDIMLYDRATLVI